MWGIQTDLARREEQGAPVRVGIIGAGRFSTLIMASIARMKGMRVALVADLDPSRAAKALERAGLADRPATRARSAGEAADAVRGGRVAIVEDGLTTALTDGIDVVVEATGLVDAGAWHAYHAVMNRKHVVMVNVEADVLVGPLLNRLAGQAGVTYTAAYGDQPALIKELYNWAVALGFEVVAAGKGTKYTPDLRRSTPDTVWDLYGHTQEEVRRAGLNPQMYNSFLDGTKSAIEMVAVSNMTGLVPDVRGMHFPPASIKDIPAVLCPREDGGILARRGVVEVVSSTRYDGTPVPDDARWGVYAVVTSDSEYLHHAMHEYGVATGGNGRYALVYRPYHYVGMETPVSIAQAALRNQATGAPLGAPVSEVVTAAKRALKPGETLDGEGGYTVYGVADTAESASRERLLPMGLAKGARLLRPVPQDGLVTYDDVVLDEDSFALKLRRMQDATFSVRR